MTIHAVGSLWEAKSKNGSVCRLYLKEKFKRFEDWRWTTYNSDGSYHGGDWGPSRTSAYNEMTINRCCLDTVWPRMKRVN